MTAGAPGAPRSSGGCRPAGLPGVVEALLEEARSVLRAGPRMARVEQGREFGRVDVLAAAADQRMHRFVSELHGLAAGRVEAVELGVRQARMALAQAVLDRCEPALAPVHRQLEPVVPNRVRVGPGRRTTSQLAQPGDHRAGTLAG